MDDDIRSRLLSHHGVAGLVEFGSSARRSGHDGSDLDLMAVMRETSVRREVRDWIEHLTNEFTRLSATALTLTELERTLARSPSFGAHLRDEGRVFGAACAQRRIQSVLSKVRVDADTVREEVLDLRQHLDRLSNERMLGGYYDTAVGRLFSIARAAAILLGITYGRSTYDWRTVFTSIADREPTLQCASTMVLSLRPYYDALDGRSTPPPPASRDLYVAGLGAARAIVESVSKGAARA